ncbi:MAG TPA: cyclase family protein [Terriglobales bacterium]|jgi:kynurenine formamidase|nr:cyclase family protein [Terriglobales bacterium]
MRIRSFIIAYALVLAILLFADRRPGAHQQDRYSHVVDLTDGPNATAKHATSLETSLEPSESRTRIIAPAAIIPGTWTAGQIPPERLVAPLVVMDLKSASEASPQISLDDIAAWEAQYGIIPPGAVVAIRRADGRDNGAASDAPAARQSFPLPIARDAALFLVEARDTIGFAVETPVGIASDRTLATQLALHGNYVVEGTASFTSLPSTGSLIIVAPAKNKKPGEAPVRILAMVR